MSKFHYLFFVLKCSFVACLAVLTASCSLSPGFAVGELQSKTQNTLLSELFEGEQTTLVYDPNRKTFIKKTLVKPTSNKLHSNKINPNQPAQYATASSPEEPDKVKTYVSKDGVAVDLIQITPKTLNHINSRTHTTYNYAPLSELYALFKKSAPEYKLASGDAVSINLWAYPQLTQQPLTNGVNTQAQGFAIDARGYIYLPLIGKTKAAGRTVPSLARSIKSRYAKFLKYPEATVKVTQYKGKRYFVTGEVKRPGQQAIEGQAVSLLDAISQAGGATSRTNFHDISLMRKSRTYRFGLQQLTANGINPAKIYIKPNDFIKIGSNEQRRIEILGEAGTSHSLTIPQDGISLTTTLAESRGINSATADGKNIYVLRHGGSLEGVSIYRIDLTKLENMALASQFKMQPKDIVYVDATGLARWNRVISLLLPSASAINTGKTLTR